MHSNCCTLIPSHLGCLISDYYRNTILLISRSYSSSHWQKVSPKSAVEPDICTSGTCCEALLLPLISRTGTIIDIGNQGVEAIEMDYIWHNLDTTSTLTVRKWVNEDVDAIVLQATRHVQMGLYTLV